MLKKETPTIIVILGATGDLTQRKIAPALFHLFTKGKLPRRTKVIGFARRELSDADFRGHLRPHVALRAHVSKPSPKLSSFLKLFTYHRGHFEERKSYTALASRLGEIDKRWKICSNKLFYLAVPPEFYKTIFRNLAVSGLTIPCGGPNEGWTPSENRQRAISQPSQTSADKGKRTTESPSGGSLTGWTRVLVEKPFGKNLATAEKLDEILGALFREEQIYRIDHYLAKEMLQNILNFRFANNLFEDLWNNQYIESIDIKLWEKIGVEERGAFYDGLGALRDVGQNHLLQIAALFTMERPADLSPPAVREERARVLKQLKPLLPSEIFANAFRAQYRGYRAIRGVNKDSITETYFRLKAFIDSPRWRGVRIAMESGKRMSEQRKEIVVTLKHPRPCLCPPGKEHFKNRIVFALEPEEKITIHFWSKKIGLELGLEERSFDFLLRPGETKTQYIEEYEKLLLDSIAGDQLLFVSTEEVKAMWRFIDPIIRAWEKRKVPLRSYAPDSAGIAAAAREAIPDAARQGRGAAVRDRESRDKKSLKKEIAVAGLGKMGRNLVLRLLEKGWRVRAYNRSPGPLAEAAKAGVRPAASFEELIKPLKPPRVVWVMVSAGKAVDDIIFGRGGLAENLSPGDVLIDGGNSFYLDSARRARKLKRMGINFVDAGVSGGPRGAREGASIMTGGEEKVIARLVPLFEDLSVPAGFARMGQAGAGHFAKMVHNGIEYGMMQAIAEGFALMKKSGFKLDLKKIAEVYNHGTVIESRLIGWLKSALENYGENFKGASGTVAHTGEGEWTVKTAKKLKISVPIIAGAFNFRVRSGKHPSYTGKILSALRHEFGGHDVASHNRKKSG